MSNDSSPVERTGTCVECPADLASLSFELRSTWRPSLPSEPPTDALVRRRIRFEADPTVPSTNQFARDTEAGSPADVAVQHGRGTFVNDGDDHCSERFLLTGRPPEPHFSTLLRVSDVDEGARPSAGLQMSEGDVTVTVGGDGIEVTAFDGTETVLRDGQQRESPYDLLVTWLGASAVVCTRPCGGRWTVHGRFTWDGNPHEGWERNAPRPWWGYDLAPGASVAVDEVSLLGTAGFGIRDPSLVTRRDGMPLFAGRYVYLACTAGAPGFGYSYQCILQLNIDTYAVELAALLFADSTGGSCYPDNAAHVVYDDRTNEFIVAFSGFGTRHLGDDDAVRVYVGRTRRNVLSGVHTVAVEQANLPTRSQVWDPYLVYDEAAGVWRCAHTYDGARVLAVSETTDESLTDGWVPVHVCEGPNEGTKLLPVDEGFLCLYTDERLPTGMAVSDYPEIGRNAAPIDVDTPTEAAFDTGFTSHPMVIPVDEGDGVRYLLVGFDGSEFAGLDIDEDTRKRTRGALYIYEAR